MRLKRVRVFGFKTFADRSEFSLEGGVVAVVGPNGCGKSNLVDAILWGLGEGNARQLRTSGGQDVIFNGSSKRKPVGFAEVNLLFDNEDGSLPIETSEVQITRKLSRSGDSDYSINRRPCRLRDIYELLADSGLGRAGYAIVGQKEIDQALSASAEDRRGWIDEAAGVQRYRARKVESLRRLESASEHLARVDDILNELVKQRDPLSAEAEVAIRYKSLLASLRAVELGLLISEVTVAVREVREQESRIAESLQAARRELARAEELETQAKTVAQNISDLEREMDTVRGLQQGSLTALERAEANLRLATQKLESLDDVEKSLQEDAGTVEDRIKEAEAEVAGLRNQVDTEFAALQDLQTEYAGAGAEAKRYAEQLKQIEAELAKAKLIVSKRLRAETERVHRAERRHAVERELAGIRGSLQDTEGAVVEAQLAFDEATVAVNNAQEAVRSLESEIVAIRQEDDTDAQAVRRSLAEKAAMEGRRRGIEATIDAHEGLAQGTRAILEAAERNQLSGSYTPVGKAISADKELALAIETALGASANDLIVDDEQDAKAAISWLKERRAGRATFQPIPLMRPQEPGGDMRRILRETGVVGRANELVSCAPKHRPVIDSLLGRVVVVETIDDALRHARTSGWSRMVTLEGEVVHSSGAVTGGQQNRQSYGLVQRKADLAELERELAGLDRVVREHDLRATKRTERRVAVDGKLAEARRAQSRLASGAQEARSFLATMSDELKSARRSGEKLERELADLNAVVPETLPDVDLPAIEAQRDELLKSVAARSADAGQAESRLREAQARREQATARLDAGIRRLQTAKEAEESRRRKLLNLGPDRARLRAEIERYGREKDQAATGKAEAEARLAEHAAERHRLLEVSMGLAEDTKAARANAVAVGDGAHQAELNRARAEARRANAQQRLLEDYGLTEEDALEQEGQHERPPDAQTVVNRLRREIRAMGDVNLGAIEAYERLTKRVDELTYQRDDITAGIEQVQASISELDLLTRDKFTTTFQAVQVAFTEMFVRLFGGGEGRLALTDSANVLQSGIELEVVLPGKRRQPLNLLSGGERALCASAFLFALLKVKPSPLVVLDEVDAPLDGRNVERFAEALSEFAVNTQFIVITHNTTTVGMAADVMLGVTMNGDDPGVSKLLPQRLPETRETATQAS